MKSTILLEHCLQHLCRGQATAGYFTLSQLLQIGPKKERKGKTGKRLKIQSDASVHVQVSVL